MALKVGELFATLNLATADFDKGLSGAGKSFAKFGKTVGILAADAIVGAAKSIGIVTTEFDAAMSQLAATMGKTVAEVGDLEAKAREMGASTKYTATEAAEGLNILAQSGLDANQQIASIETVLNLASAGAMDLGTSAGFITTAVKGWGDSMSNAQMYADLMAKGATLANTDVTALGEALSGVAATANSYGQSAQSTTVALLRLAEQGITGSEAVTGLKRGMQLLYAPTSTAAKQLDALGVSAYDAGGKEKDFNQVVDELNTSLGQLGPEARNAAVSAIFGARGMSVFNAMVAASDATVTKFNDELSGASDGIGSAASQAATQIDNLQGDITILQSATEGLELSIGKSMNDAAREAVKGLTSVVDAANKAFVEGLNPESIGTVADKAFSFLTGITDKVISIATDITEGISMALPALASSIASALPGIVSKITKALPKILKNIVAAIPKALGDFAAAIPSIVSSLFSMAQQAVSELIGMLPQLATDLIDGFNNLVSSAISVITFNNMDGPMPSLQDMFTEGIDNVKNGIESISSLDATPKFDLKSLLSPFKESVSQFVTGIVDWISEQDWSFIWSSLWSKITDLTGWVATSIIDFNTFLTQLVTEITNWVSGDPLGGQDFGFGTLWDGFWTYLSDVEKWLGDVTISFSSLVSAITDGVLTLYDRLIAWFSSIDWGGVWQKLWDGLTNIAQFEGNIVLDFSSVLQSIVDKVQTWINGDPLGDGANLDFSAFWHGFFDYFTNLDTWLPDTAAVVGNLIGSFTRLFGEFAGMIGQAIGSLFSGGEEGANGDAMSAQIESALTAMIETLSDVGKQFITGIATGITGQPLTWDQISSAFTGWIDSGVEAFKQFGADLINGIGEGIKSAWDSIVNWIKAEINDLVRNLPFIEIPFPEVEQPKDPIEPTEGIEYEIIPKIADTSNIDISKYFSDLTGQINADGFFLLDMAGLIPTDEDIDLVRSMDLSGQEDMIRKALDSLDPSMFETEGENAAAGYNEGMMNGDVTAGATAMVTDALEQTRAAQASGSPAAAFMPVGTEAAQGYEQGMMMYPIATGVAMLVNSAMATLNALSATFSIPGKSAGTAYNSGLSESLTQNETITAAVTAAAESAAKAASDMKSAFQSAGKDFGQGLVNGMGSMLQPVINKAKQLALSAKNAVTETLQIGSPSRVAAEQGKFFGLGLAKGIMDSLKYVNDASVRIAGAATDAVQLPSFGGGRFAQRDVTTAAGAANDPSMLAGAIATAMREQDMSVNINGQRVGNVMASDNNKAINARTKRLAFGYGG